MASETVAAAPSHWWLTLTDECPITLEPLSTLSYPPFALYSDHRGDDRPYRFDGLALASYAVSRGCFQNPLTREPLTRKDCRRLDCYLEENCYHRGGGGGGRGESHRLCVAEAFSLRELVRVPRTTTSARSSRHGESFPGAPPAARAALSESEILRSESLRNEAAAALRGLFVYGNDRRPMQQWGRYSESLLLSNSEPGDTSVPRVGFNLYGRLRDGYEDNGEGAAVVEVEGLKIIDDNLEIAESAEASAWRELDDAFPRISAHASTGEDDERDISASTAVEGDCFRSDLLRKAQEAARRSCVEEDERERSREKCQQRITLEAIRRRDEQLKKKRVEQVRRRLESSKEKEVREEVTRAREEIDQWRTQQWEEMIRLSDGARRREKDELMQKKKAQAEDETIKVSTRKSKEGDEESNQISKEGDKAAKAVAKKAAKRRREKERQKIKKAAEMAKAQMQRKFEEVRKKKETSSMKCGACGEGIIDCGFERLGLKFCSTKCARAGLSKKA